MITKIWYSVQNGGDGSAYPKWMESEELCLIDQDYMYEGWGEPCIGCITIESNGPIKILEEIETIDDVIAQTKDDMEYSEEFLQKKLNELIKLKGQ